MENETIEISAADLQFIQQRLNSGPNLYEAYDRILPYWMRVRIGTFGSSRLQ